MKNLVIPLRFKKTKPSFAQERKSLRDSGSKYNYANVQEQEVINATKLCLYFSMKLLF